MNISVNMKVCLEFSFLTFIDFFYTKILTFILNYYQLLSVQNTLHYPDLINLKTNSEKAIKHIKDL